MINQFSPPKIKAFICNLVIYEHNPGSNWVVSIHHHQLDKKLCFFCCYIEKSDKEKAQNFTEFPIAFPKMFNYSSMSNYTKYGSE